MQTTIAAFDMLKQTGSFSDLHHVASSTIQISSLALGRTKTPDDEKALINQSIAGELRGLEALQSTFSRLRRRSRALRKADDAFQDYLAELDQYADFHRSVRVTRQHVTRRAQLADHAIVLGNATRHEHFDVYWDDFRESSLIAASQRVDGFERKEQVLVITLEDVSAQSGNLAFCITCVAAVLWLTSLLVLCRQLVVYRREHSAMLAAQDRLLYQQAHEMRSKYAPASFFIQQFIDTCDQAPVPPVRDFLGQRDDM